MRVVKYYFCIFANLLLHFCKNAVIIQIKGW
nr:MAG TPA: hypothetical protein [Bacteriophage sp.]